MTNKHNNEREHDVILVSKTGIVGFIIFALGMTFFLMFLFTWLDFDSLLGRKNLAIKVGSTNISLSDFKKIKEISGKRVKNLSDQSFAEELFETLLLAEDARRKNLDSNPEFKKKIQKFDRALKNSEDSEKIAKSIFLLEELARAAIKNIVKNEITRSKPESQQKAQTPKKIKLHLRTIKVNTASEAEQVKQAVVSGTDFSLINASYSTSLYKSVGGDLGWKTKSDLPAGVFEKLLKQKNNKLTLGFTDNNGFHFYQVLSKHETSPEGEPDKSKPSINKNRIIYKHLATLKSEINYWINPSLLAKRGISAEKSKDATK
ncbi:MAG: peptidylprolyl isomerase [Candidatus Rifleibacteriota bacterium]